MSLVLLGVNHKTAPIDLRERLAIAPERLPEAVRLLAARPDIREALILCTCNRVELLASQEPGAGEDSSSSLHDFLNEYFAVDDATLRPHLYEFHEREAVRHVFRVASSLDSMVIGEAQILGQVKESYAVARSVGAVHGELERLLQSAFTVAKKIRTTTEIGSSSVSIASVAVELAKKIFGTLDGKRVLLVGAGKMSELAARHLIHQGANSILVANRTEERAARLAEEFHGRVVPFAELYETADQADIVITSTGASRPIFRREHGQRLMQKRRNRPMFFIDIAVPRDVDPAMNRVDGIFLYDIDDLQSVAASHLEGRAQEAEQAERVIAREVERFHERLQTVNAVPTIVNLQQSAEEIRRAELERMAARLQSLNAEQRAAVEALTRGMMNKFLHPPLQAAKAAAREGDAVTLDALRAAFDYQHALRAIGNTAGGSAGSGKNGARPAAGERRDAARADEDAEELQTAELEAEKPEELP